MSEMTYEVGLRIRITEEMSRQLAEAAAATGKTVTQLVRQAIAAQLRAVSERERAAFEVLP